MKVAPLLPLLFWLLCACAPQASGPGAAPAKPRAASSPSTSAGNVAALTLPATYAASYEVSIASAEADRVRARELCDSKAKVERSACNEAADAAYDQAKSAADGAHIAGP